MKVAYLPKVFAGQMRAVGFSRQDDEINGTRVWLWISLLGHSALFVAVLLCLASRPSSLPEVIPVSVITLSEAENLSRNGHVETLPNSSSKALSKRGAVRSESDPTSTSRPKSALTLVGEASSHANHSARQSSVPQAPHPAASDSKDIPAIQEARVKREEPYSGVGAGQALPERYLWNTAQAAPASGEGRIDFVEVGGQSPGLTVTRRTDWQANPVEDDKLTYSAPGSAVKLTVREASSAGFLRTDLAHGIRLNNDETSGPFGLNPEIATSLARSQRVDWTLVNLKNFGITAFGYQNEVGRGFQPFGQTKTEFGIAGSSTMKAGGQVRIGAFGFGLAQSSIAEADESAGTYFRSNTTDSTVQQEASASINLAQFVEGGLAPKLVPTLWMSTSTSQGPTSGQASEIVTTSFGGTWTWDRGSASLAYWNYSCRKNEGLGNTWTGDGFDANLVVARSSFGIDVGLSYGQSKDAAPSWQSEGVLYNSHATVSYQPDKLPGVSLTAAAGNYEHHAITDGGTLSEPYAMASNGEYLSLTAGIDLTSLFWSPDESGVNEQRPSVKMFYRYSDNLFLDGSANATKDVDSLVAMSIQRKF